MNKIKKLTKFAKIAGDETTVCRKCIQQTILVLNFLCIASIEFISLYC